MSSLSFVSDVCTFHYLLKIVNFFRNKILKGGVRLEPDATYNNVVNVSTNTKLFVGKFNQAILYIKISMKFPAISHSG